MKVSHVETESRCLWGYHCKCYDADKDACYDPVNKKWVSVDDVDVIASSGLHTFGKKYKCPVCGSEISFEEVGYTGRVIKIEHKERPRGFVFARCEGGYKLTGCDLEDKVIAIPGDVNGRAVLSLSEGCFWGISNKTIIIPESVKRIEPGLCNDLYNVDIYLPDNMTELTDYIVFLGNRVRVHIPSTVTAIHEYAFGDTEPTIFGVKGSAAEIFANEHNWRFKEE